MAHLGCVIDERLRIGLHGLTIDVAAGGNEAITVQHVADFPGRMREVTGKLDLLVADAGDGLQRLVDTFRHRVANRIKLDTGDASCLGVGRGGATGGGDQAGGSCKHFAAIERGIRHGNSRPEIISNKNSLAERGKYDYEC